jgi:hypothetical protein
VQSVDGLSLPGVLVTASSPVLQGQRSATTDVNGVYVIKGLPAGAYSVTFEISSFKPATKEVEINVGSTVDVGQTMALAGVTETVNVLAESPKPSALTTPTLSLAFTKTDLDPLPVGRVPSQIADLAPGLTSSTPNAGQVTISGATAFDNVFMINGVDVNDNLLRDGKQPVHRRRHPADQCPDGRHLGRVRTVFRRRHQRHHQERREHVWRELPRELEQPEVDR